MLKITEIVKAWVAASNPTPEQQALAEYRASVCDSCEHKAYAKHIDLYYCNSCGCPLDTKIFSPLSGPQACPLAKWKK